MFNSCTKSEIKKVSRRSRTVTAKKCTKKRDALAKLLFWLSLPLLSPSSVPKLMLAEFILKSETDKSSRYKFGV